MAQLLKKVDDDQIDEIAGLSNLLEGIRGVFLNLTEHIQVCVKSIMELIPNKNWFVVPILSWNIEMGGEETLLELYEFV